MGKEGDEGDVIKIHYIHVCKYHDEVPIMYVNVLIKM